MKKKISQDYLRTTKWPSTYCFGTTTDTADVKRHVKGHSRSP